MSRTAKLKRKPAAVNSRAARRATSPSLDLDKSLKSAPAAEGSKDVLAVQHGSGISKKRRAKSPSRQQKLRRRRGIERADVVISQFEKKMAQSKLKGRMNKDRRADWDDLNAKATRSKVEAQLMQEFSQDKTHADTVEDTQAVKDTQSMPDTSPTRTEEVILPTTTEDVPALPGSNDELDEIA